MYDNQLRMNETSDFENPTDENNDNVYEIEVQATGSNGEVASRLIKVEIKDVFDDPAEFQLPTGLTKHGQEIIARFDLNKLDQSADESEKLSLPIASVKVGGGYTIGLESKKLPSFGHPDSTVMKLRHSDGMVYLDIQQYYVALLQKIFIS